VKTVVAKNAHRRDVLRRQLWIWPLAAAALLLFVGVWVRRHMEGAIRQQIAANLTSVLDANAEALRAWATSAKSQAELLAGGETARVLIEHLLEFAARPDTSAAQIAAAPAAVALRTYLKPVEEGHGFAGYAVLDTNLMIVAAGQEYLVGKKSPPEYADPLKACFAGEIRVTAPFAVAGISPDQTRVTRGSVPLMFAAAPVRSTGGQLLAVLALRILPERDFTRILSTARPGVSGETYAFDRNGLLLSESRFDDELRRWGLIPDEPGSRSLLALDLRDPLVDLREGLLPLKRRTELPHIKPVNEAPASGQGLDVRGYRNYRGATVVGAWRWMPEFDMGLVTELDYGEAIAPLRAVRQGFWFLFGLLTAAAGVVFLLARVARQASLEANQLGQYALDDQIGSGAFGTVFRAHHALMRRPVAVKVLSPTADERAIARFEREVQMTCQLTHPNTIALYDYGRTENGLFYYAMEYLDGLSLDQLLKEHGTQPEPRVIHILRQVCASLSEAHARGLVHRDIKPQNIFLTCRGGIPDFVKVLDFGLVKARQAERELELTGANATMGTPLYMSPEAVEHADKVTALSDLYSLGSVGYQLLTGETPFCGSSIGEILLQQVQARPEKPSVRLKHPVSADLEDLLMRCLAKKPSDRPASAGELAESLSRCVCGNEWTCPAAEQWWRDRSQVAKQSNLETVILPTSQKSWFGP
jgi:eukaryotic-like serine/threonine-protein kinase